MNPSKSFCLLSFPPAREGCRMRVAMAGDTSLIRILAAADMDDAEDVAIRESLFVALRDFGAGAQRARPRTRRGRRRVACDVRSSLGSQRPLCPVRPDR
jgi:hypothetical protein